MRGEQIEPEPVWGWEQLLAQGGICLAQPWLVAAGTTGSPRVSCTARGYLEAIATEAQDLLRAYNILLDHF